MEDEFLDAKLNDQLYDHILNWNLEFRRPLEFLRDKCSKVDEKEMCVSF